MNNADYETRVPSTENVIELFSDWISRVPMYHGGNCAPNALDLFYDQRIKWAHEVFGKFHGKTVLELGPLEGGHSYMLHDLGAYFITAIESNKVSFLKCLCTKELFDLPRCHFLLGDFVKYLENSEDTFDVVIASGVLYHMTEPLKLIKLISERTNMLFLWTHYYPENGEKLYSDFAAPRITQHESFSSIGYPKFYRKIDPNRAFFGGAADHGLWLKRSTILHALKHFGFNKLEINFEDTNHPIGPAFAVCAMKV